MSNNRRIYRDIQKGLKQLYPAQRLNGHQLKHLTTLTAMVSGIVQGKSCRLEKIAREIPDSTQVESRVKRYSRLLQHEVATSDRYYLPFVSPLIDRLSQSGPITLVIDGSEVGRQCMTLMISAVYHGRAIPLTWLVVQGAKGHLSEALHLELLEQVTPLLPKTCDVIFLGDGEFDGIQFQEAINRLGWHYVLRTAKNCLVHDNEDQFALKEVGIRPGQRVDIPDVKMTGQEYGPVNLIIWWKRGHDKPIYLVTNFDCFAEACHFYRKRFRIETFFSDQKSRGFNLHQSHQAIPERLSRLLIPACLAYIWIIFLGTQAKAQPKIMKQIHRADRCDLSLFQIGLRYLQYLLNQGLNIPISFLLPVF